MTEPGLRNVVVDTNVHFGAWRSKREDSPCREVVVRGVRRHYRIAVSASLLGEIYEKMTEELSLPSELALRYIALLASVGVMYADVADEDVWCSDPGDAYLLVLVFSSKAWCVVFYDSVFFDPKRWRAPAEVVAMQPLEFLFALREARRESPGQRAHHGGSLDTLTASVASDE